MSSLLKWTKCKLQLSLDKTTNFTSNQTSKILQKMLESLWTVFSALPLYQKIFSSQGQVETGNFSERFRNILFYDPRNSLGVFLYHNAIHNFCRYLFFILHTKLGYLNRACHMKIENIVLFDNFFIRHMQLLAAIHLAHILGLTLV